MPSVPSRRRPTSPVRSSAPRALRCLSLAIVSITALLVAGAAQAGSLRCDGKLVEVGDPKLRLLDACGEPASREVIAVVRGFEDGRERRSEHSEVWAYEKPSVDGYQLLRFEGGRLIGKGMRCSGELVEAGHTTSTVLKRCGEPASRDAAGLVNESPVPASQAATSEALVEQWIYSRGSGSFLKIVELRGGRIERIEDGPRQ